MPAKKREDDWAPRHVWRAVGPKGDLWAESSSEVEVRALARETDVVEQYYVRPQGEWRPASAPSPETLAAVESYRATMAEES